MTMEYCVRKRSIEQVGWSTAAAAVREEDALSDAVLRRFHLRAGFTTTSPRALEMTRNFYGDFLRKVLDATLVFMQHHNRRSILLTDVLRACTHYGIRLYGFDDMCVLEGPWGIEEYHVTEMVEANTTFRQAALCEEEPDEEPSHYYKKTDFVQNQRAWNAQDEEEDWGSDDSEWSWYGDSDADSDSEEEDDEVEEQLHAPHRWKKGEDSKETFLRSLQDAQQAVDKQLLVQNCEAEIIEGDAPPGQGYESDCDSSREPISLQAWRRNALREEAKWGTVGNVLEYDEGDTDDSSSDDRMDDFDDEISAGDDEYVIPRQIFMSAVYGQMDAAFNCSLPITAVALSALHNVSEQSLHAALTDGALKAQIVSALMEDRLEATLSMQIELEEERHRIAHAEAAMRDMEASFKAKELEMQRKIAELEQQLRQREDPVKDVAMEPKQKVSPGKRKAKSVDGPELSKPKPSTSTSIVGSLRSRLTEYSLRKKAKISPV